VGSSGCTDDPDAVDDDAEFDVRDADDRSDTGKGCIADDAPDKGATRENLIRLVLIVEAEWPGPEGRLTSAEAGMCRVETMHVVRHSDGAEFTRFVCSRNVRALTRLVGSLTVEPAKPSLHIARFVEKSRANH
jgi:hypothetical protein